MNSDLLRKTLMKAEGVRTKVYKDSVGKLTIGVGRNLEDVGLSLTEIDMLLTNDVAHAWLDLGTVLPWVMGLSDVRQRALTEMVFNLGMNGVLQFKKALSAMESGSWSLAKEELLDSHWAEQVRSRANRIAAMIETDKDVI